MADEVKDENINSQNDTSQEDENTEVDDESTDIEDESAEDESEDEDLKEKNKKLFYRAKKAEGFVQQPDGTWLRKFKPRLVPLEEADKPKHKSEIKKDPSPSEETIDEKILRATKGYDDEAMAELKAIAKGKGMTLLQAEQDKIFKIYLKEAEAEKKKAEAALGGSKGAGKKKSEVDVSTPNLTDEQHRELAKKYGIT